MKLSVDSTKMSLIFCAGGGNLGTEAAQTARLQGTVLVVDPDPQCRANSVADAVVTDLAFLELDRKGKIQLLIGRAEEVLLDLIDFQAPDLVIPAVTGHFAAMVARRALERKGLRMIPDVQSLRKVSKLLPNEVISVVDDRNAVLITSHMPPGQICKTPCVQASICPVTGKHKTPMYRMISEALQGSNHLVMISHLLGRVGAIHGSEFENFVATVRSLKNGDTMALATSCHCHAITNFFIAAPI